MKFLNISKWNVSSCICKCTSVWILWTWRGAWVDSCLTAPSTQIGSRLYRAVSAHEINLINTYSRQMAKPGFEPPAFPLSKQVYKYHSATEADSEYLKFPPLNTRCQMVAPLMNWWRCGVIHSVNSRHYTHVHYSVGDVGFVTVQRECHQLMSRSTPAAGCVRLAAELQCLTVDSRVNHLWVRWCYEDVCAELCHFSAVKD